MSQKLPVPQKLNSEFFKVSLGAKVLTWSEYICVKITGSATDFIKSL